MERIVGKNLTLEGAKIIAQKSLEKKEKWKEFFEGEFEKTAEDLKVIEKINSYLGQEFTEAGCKEKPEQILPEQIHYISTESYDKNFPEVAEGGSKAAYFENLKAIFINAEAYRRESKYYATLHEMTHAASFHQLRAEEKERKIKYKASKCGYGTAYIFNKGKIKINYQFKGFNEAVTEKITRETLNKHKEEIVKEFNFSEKESKSLFAPGGYENYLKILDAAIKKTAEKNGETEENVWKKIRKGYLEGEMMHLRDIESACGTGALRMLATIGKSPDFASRSEVSEMILIYFQTDDESKKKEIADIILKEEELKKYQKRRK